MSIYPEDSFNIIHNRISDLIEKHHLHDPVALRPNWEILITISWKKAGFRPEYNIESPLLGLMQIETVHMLLGDAEKFGKGKGVCLNVRYG